MVTARVASIEDHATRIPPDTIRVSHAILVNYPGPALLCDGIGPPTALNAEGERLAACLLQLPQVSQLEKVNELCAQAMRRGATLKYMFSIDIDGASQSIDAAFMAVGDGNVVILGRTATLDVNMRTALVESRQRYKDLVEISSDFAWETDANGIYTFVSPRGAMGFAASEIVGRPARSFLYVPDAVPQNFVFETEELLEHVELWLKDATDNPVCVLASAIPLRHADGSLTGVRGVCRDVTADRVRENELTRHKKREQIISYIVEAVRNEAKPGNMLNAAVKSVSQARSATSCAVFKVGESGKLTLAAKHGVVPNGRHLAAAINSLDRAIGTQETLLDGFRILVEPTHYREAPNGATLLCRSAATPPWDDDDKLLLQAVAGQLGIALQQINDQQELVRLSRTDPLTGLFNRRAFLQELRPAMERTQRNRASSAILYLDLNNFKHVNDTLGHEAGDQVLKRLSGILTGITRSYDFVARLGGDEFVVWLENVDKETAFRRARTVLASKRILCDSPIRTPGKQLGLSIGIALFEHDYPETPEELMSRADEAMYRAKNNNKQDIAIARHRRSGRHGA
ncbi:MAG: diguanylate cyclase [Alphaproteobacteria bacterium]